MHDIFSGEPDSLDAMLRPASPLTNDVLRQAVYDRTRLVLHRRRRLRQLAYAAALLVSFAAGLLVTRFSMPSPVPPVTPDVAVAPPKQPIPPDKPPAPPAPPQPRSAFALEWQAFDSLQERGALYRQAGERYLQEEHDLQSALRCLGNYLDNGTEQDLAISSDDNWLLMAIKVARQKEKRHAKQSG
ncbi:MAG TPA: hypothetical protein VE999_08815 [Gemmataceae bacterium]|nr:hypothetical protein [Gemmataceae bacterium]